MASFDFCVNAALKNGQISKDVADHIKGAPDPDTAINSLVGNLNRQKREAAIDAVRRADAWRDISSHGGTKYDGLIALHTKDPTGRAGYKNVEYLGKFYEKKYFSQFAEAMSRFRTRSLGFEQDQEGLRNLVKAIYGEAVDDPEIMRFAQDWAKVTENIRAEFNAKGGSISKNEKWLLPQMHDERAILDATLPVWKKRISVMLDRNAMLDDAGKPLNDADFDASLDYVYETITTGGLNKTKDFTVPRLGKKLSRKGSEKRFLYFKDAESWLEYQKEFGKGDVFRTLTGHIETKANDIALMEVFGTNPEANFKALKAQVEKGQKLKGRQKFLLNAVFNVVSGKTNQGELTGVSDFMQSTRNVIVASTLGSAFLSSISDVATQALTSRYNAMPTFKALSRQLSLLDPTKEADRIFAAKIGFVSEGWTNMANGSNRYADVFGTGVTAKAAEAVMRGSLLSPWTDAGRKAFGMEYSSMLADNFSKKLADLDPNTQRAFEAYGIDSKDWDAFRASKPLDFKGAKFADMTQEGGKKFHMMVLSETDFAVPTPDAKVRAITTGGLGRSTVEGQAWRTAMMLKSFPITIAATHFYRAAYQATAIDVIGYSATLAVTTTVMGGIALQAKDIAVGREPRPADNLKFFGAAFMQGGGLGIFGDFLFSDKNRFGGGITQTLTGPTGEMLDKLEKFTIGNIQQAFAGEETNVLGEAFQLGKRYLPDTWQTRLFTDAFFDQMELMANPKAQRRFNRMIRKRQKDFNQGYWWKPGNAPEFVR